MNWFGLGIMLKFQDNASVGLGTVLNSIEGLTKSLSKAGSVSGQYAEKINASLSSIGNDFIKGGTLLELGSGFASASKTMLSGLTAIGTETVKTGAKYENWRTTLKALYGDAEVAQQKLQWGLNLAAQTPFEVDDVTQAIIGFKAVGAEADKMFESSNGEMRSFLEYMGDLAALRPDVGLNGLLMGIRNLLGGDNGRSLKMRMDIDLSQFTEKGEWGDTTEEIMSQLVEASDKLANGLMGELEGTWDQMISNLEDQKTRFLLAIADNGFFEGAKKSLKRIFDVVDAIDDEKMTKIGKNIADAFNLAWKPIDKFVGVLAKGIEVLVNLLANNPMVSKLAVGFVVLTSAILGFGAIVLTVVGSLFIFKGIMSAIPLLVRLLSKTFVSALPSILSFTKIATIGALVYKAWKSDFGGIRTILTTFMKNVKTAFSYSSDIANMGTQDMINALNQLDKTKFGDWLTYRLVQVRVLWMALVDAWNDNTLSDENFEKARQLGLLPLIEAILDAKAKIEAFWEGFKKGFQNVSDFLKPIIAKITDAIGNIAVKLFPIQEGVGGVNKSLKGLNVGKWERFGEITAYVVSGIAGLWAFGKVVGIIASVGKAIGTVISFVGKIPGVFKSVVSFLGRKILMPILAGIGSVVTAILGAFGIVISAPAWVVGAITVAIVGAIALLIKYKDKAIEIAGKILGGIASVITGVVTGILVAILSVGVALSTFFMTLGGVIGTICGVIAGVIATLVLGVELIIKSALEIVVALIKTAIQVIIGTISVIVGVVSTIMMTLGGIISTALAIIKGLFDTVIAVIKAVWTGDFTSLGETIKSIWSGVGDRIKEIWNSVCDRVRGLWNGVKDILLQAFHNIKDTWVSAMDNIQSIAGRCVDAVKNVWNGIGSFFSGIWQGIKDSAASMFNWLADKFAWVTKSINAVKGFFNWGGDKKSKNDINIETKSPKPKVGLATGGFVKDEGVAMLHPNEVVVNDELTQGLRNFLAERERGVELNTPLNHEVVNNIEINPIVRNAEVQTPVTREANTTIDNSKELFNTISNSNNYNNSRTINHDNTASTVDNSIVFNEGAIQVTLENGGQEDVEKLFKLFMTKLKKEKSLRSTLNYRPSLA